METLEGKEEISTEQVFINTGARPFIPPIEGIRENPHVYLSEDLLNLKELPKRLVIIGGGYIGMEFASMYQNFGSEVTVIQDGPVFLPREDEEIALAVLSSLKQRGIDILLSTKIKKVETDGEKTTVLIENDGVQQRIAADAILIATGRRPNIEGLNLEQAGVKLTERGGVKTDEHLRTTAENIWAMGDVVGGLQFTYISFDDYRIVRSQVLGDGKRTTANRPLKSHCGCRSSVHLFEGLHIHSSYHE